jgi:hypothetical protein
MVNGIATALTLTLATAAPVTGSNLINTVAVVAGDLVSLRATKAAVLMGAGDVDVQVTVEF